MSNGDATFNRWITRSRFRDCSRCLSRSKAGFYPCALCMIADHAEPTFELLRYFFGGNRPSQTDPLTLFPARITGSGLDSQPPKGGISRMSPPPLARGFQRLPPILHADDRMPVSDYSKGSRDLSVLPRVSGIFTGITISPGTTSRQRPDRCTIRAGRNLPDKEFRYLRTVIVTADIHRGFVSGLAPVHLTFRHWSRVTPYTSSCEFAESCVFGKQSPGPLRCDPLRLGEQSPVTGGGTPSSEVTGPVCRVP